MNAVAIARVNLRRLFRDRSTLFFVFILPLLVIVLVGSAFGGGFTPRVAMAGPVDESLAAGLVANVEAGGAQVLRLETAQAVTDAVARGQAQAGLIVPDGYDAAIASGAQATVEIVVRPENQAMRTTIDAAVRAETMAWRAARFAAETAGGSQHDHLALAEAATREVPGVTVTATTVGDAAVAELERLGRFDLGASQQLLLFVFLTSLTGATALIQTRQLGVAHRVLATPTRTHTIVAGEGLGRFGVALVQGGYIMVGAFLLFDVRWGDPLGAAAVLVLFAAVSAAAALLIGSSLRNDTQAAGVGLLAALGLGALGGAMVPIEFFPPGMVSIARVTPHAWGLDAFAELLRRGGTLADILPQLGVLALFASVLGVAATWQLHRRLTGARP